MKSVCTGLAVALLSSGCQSAGRSRGPYHLDARLRVVESARLDGLCDRQAPRFDERGLGQTPASLGLSQAQPVWTLGDFGGVEGDITAADVETWTDGSTGEADRADREEKYSRRRPLASFRETLQRDVRYAPRDLWRDTKRVYGSPTNLVILGATYGGALALQQTGPDRSVERHFLRDGPFGTHRVHRHTRGGWRDAFATAGNPGTHFGLAGLFYLIGQQAGDDKTYEVGKTLFSALAINGVTVMLGQAATHDRAPNGERGTMPSGHTSSSFVVASVLHEAYGHAVGIPLYALAALVAHERLESNEHYLADVVMGAVLGTVVGHSVASGREPEFFGWKLHPWASPSGGTGIAFVKTLP